MAGFFLQPPMSSANKNLSDFDNSSLPDVSEKKFAIIVSEWNQEITDALYHGAYSTLIEAGVHPNNIKKIEVPGSFELTAGARKVAQDYSIDAVICLGCVIEGETRHFEFICNAVASGLTQLTVHFNKPFIFGVLTTQNTQQAKERAGGKHGNKGVEAAVTAIKMSAL